MPLSGLSLSRCAHAVVNSKAEGASPLRPAPPPVRRAAGRCRGCGAAQVEPTHCHAADVFAPRGGCSFTPGVSTRAVRVVRSSAHACSRRDWHAVQLLLACAPVGGMLRERASRGDAHARAVAAGLVWFSRADKRRRLVRLRLTEPAPLLTHRRAKEASSLRFSSRARTAGRWARTAARRTRLLCSRRLSSVLAQAAGAEVGRKTLGTAQKKLHRCAGEAPPALPPL